jgi:hypothetical protein
MVGSEGKRRLVELELASQGEKAKS